MSKTTSFFLSLALVIASFVPTNAQATNALTNIDIVTMVRDKTSVAIIKATINSSPTNFDISPTGISQLTKLGVSETLILAMVERQGQVGAVSVGGAVPAAGGSGVAAGTTQPTQAAAGATTLGPKRKGIPRIGIVTTQTTVPLEQDEAVRAQFYDVLFGNRETSSAEAVLMREKLDRNIVSEAAFTKCDYLLFVRLETTIESASKNRTNLLQRGIQAAAQGLGAAAKMSSPLGVLSGITYQGYQMADSLQTSTTLLETITDATRKNDKIGINVRMVNVATSEVVIPQTLKEIVAQKKREPILQNLLIQLGNDVVNKIPAPTILPIIKM